jgi:hypothetical protein
LIVREEDRDMLRAFALTASILTVVLAAGCGGSSTSNSQTPAAGSATTTTPPPSAEPPAASTADGAKPLTVAEIFPPGPGRDQVLNTCGSCHPVACSALGQRTADRWDTIKEGHKDKLTSASDADVTAMFDYLKANFNDAKPEPKIPTDFLAQGCTPF